MGQQESCRSVSQAPSPVQLAYETDGARASFDLVIRQLVKIVNTFEYLSSCLQWRLIGLTSTILHVPLRLSWMVRSRAWKPSPIRPLSINDRLQIASNQKASEMD